MKPLTFFLVAGLVLLAVMLGYETNERKALEQRHYDMIIYTLDELRTFENGQVRFNQQTTEKFKNLGQEK